MGQARTRVGPHLRDSNKWQKADIKMRLRRTSARRAATPAPRLCPHKTSAASGSIRYDNDWFVVAQSLTVPAIPPECVSHSDMYRLARSTHRSGHLEHPAMHEVRGMALVIRFGSNSRLYAWYRNTRLGTRPLGWTWGWGGHVQGERAWHALQLFLKLTPRLCLIFDGIRLSICPLGTCSRGLRSIQLERCSITCEIDGNLVQAHRTTDDQHDFAPSMVREHPKTWHHVLCANERGRGARLGLGSTDS